MKLFIPILILSQILFSQCDSLPYDGSQYYYYPNLDENHVGSTLDCYYSTDWNILNELIILNDLSENDVSTLGSQIWDANGRLKNFTLDFSSAASPQYINQKIYLLPENFGELIMLETLQMWYHDLTILPPTFPQLYNLKALYMKGNKLKVLNPNFGSLTQLSTLDLGYNELISLPESISELVNLNYFWIFGNDISYIPNSVCEIDIDWSGEEGDFIYFGSGGNHLCENIPECIESSAFFNIMLEEQGYAFQIGAAQVCECTDGNYPDCSGLCPADNGYGYLVDGCGICNEESENCVQDCSGNWGGEKVLDCLGVCEGDAIVDCSDVCNGNSSLDCLGVCEGDAIVDCSGICDGDAVTDECGICEGDGSTCVEVGYIYLDTDTLNNYYIRYETPESENWRISGFQFNVVGSSEFTQSGGVAEELGFSMQISGQLILGFSFTGTTISPGTDTLLVIHSNSHITSLTDLTFSDAMDSNNVQQLNFIFNDGSVENCELEFDCFGVCGGVAILDECGVCDGNGISIGTCDCDGNFPVEDYDCDGNLVNCEESLDCNGECGGMALIDDCGVCNGIGSIVYYYDNDGDGLGDLSSEINLCYQVDNYVLNSLDQNDSDFCPYGDYYESVIDCEGTCLLDVCGTCEGEIENLDDCDLCPLDVDICGICGGDGSSCIDCTGELNGDAIENECGCVGGSTDFGEDYCIGCKDQFADNYCEDCSITCGLFTILNDCCLYDLSNQFESIPTEFTIKNNYPNPFNPETNIKYSIPQTAWVSLSIYDIKGELVSLIIDGVASPGNYSVTWNGNNSTNRQMPTGIYFAILKTNEILVSHKLLLMK